MKQYEDESPKVNGDVNLGCFTLFCFALWTGLILSELMRIGNLLEKLAK